MGTKNSKTNPKNYYTITQSNNNQGFVPDDDLQESFFKAIEKRRQMEMEILQQLKDEGMSLTNHRTGGVAYYVPVNEKKSRLRKPPKLQTKQKLQRADLCSFSSEERQIIAEIMHRNNLRQRGETARIQSDKLMKASQRRELMKRERKEKHEIKMKKIAEVKKLREEKLKQIKLIAQNSIQHPGIHIK